MTYSIKPAEHEVREARQTVEKTLEGCKYVVEKDESLNISLGHAQLEEVKRFGVAGTALDSENAEIFFNANVENWKDNLEDLCADLYGQTWYYEKSETTFVWQQILASVTGLIVIEKISEPREVEISDLKDEWAEKKTRISDKISDRSENLSWQLKTAIGHELMEEYDLDDLPDLNRSDILDAGDALFS